MDAAVAPDVDDEIAIRNCIVEILVMILKTDPSQAKLKKARESITEAVKILKESE